MSPRRNPLLEILRDPTAARGFSIDEWNTLLSQGRRERFLARTGCLLEQAGISAEMPGRALEITQAARTFIAFHQVQIRREVRRLSSALADIGVDLILLKGAAYLLAELPLSQGRQMADVDILVPRADLGAVEKRLAARGWRTQRLDGYDQRYYREWMHEIPPLLNPESGIEADIHHALLPMTARVRPDPERLRQASIPLATVGLRTLAPTDMVLHSAAHLFYDGEIAGGLRDLLDLHLLFTEFGRDLEFWPALLQRAEQLELGRPLYYAVRYCRRFLGTSVPEELVGRLESEQAPARATRYLMDRLVGSVLPPGLPGEREPRISAWLLYVRSHWLRMPPWLLAKHLARKAWRRIRGKATETKMA